MIWSCVSDFEHKWKEWMKHRLIDIDFLRLNLELEKMKIMIERVKNEISKDTSKVGQLKLMNELDSDLK